MARRDYRALPLFLAPHWPETEALLRAGDIELAREDVRRWGELVGGVPRFRVGYLRSLALLALYSPLPGGEGSGVRAALAQQVGELYQGLGEEDRAHEAFKQGAEIAQTLAAGIDDEGLRVEFLTTCGIILTNDEV